MLSVFTAEEQKVQKDNHLGQGHIPIPVVFTFDLLYKRPGQKVNIHVIVFSFGKSRKLQGTKSGL